MWDLPRPGLEPVSSALAGRFSTTAPPGKPCMAFFWPHSTQNFPNQGLNPCSLHWKCRVLTAGPRGKSLYGFFNISYPVTLAGTYSTTLNGSDGSERIFLVSSVMEQTFFFTIQYNISSRFSVGFCRFILLRKFSSFLLFWEYYHEWVLNFIKFFFYIYWDDHMVFLFWSVNTLHDISHHIDGYLNVKTTLHSTLGYDVLPFLYITRFNFL